MLRRVSEGCEVIRMKAEIDEKAQRDEQAP